MLEGKIFIKQRNFWVAKIKIVIFFMLKKNIVIFHAVKLMTISLKGGESLQIGLTGPIWVEIRPELGLKFGSNLG